MDEVKEKVKNDLPLECYKVTSISHFRIIEKEYLVKCYVFLNNYMSYRDITSKFLIMDKDELNELSQRQCNSCKLLHSGYGFDCRYIKGNDKFQCLNYKESFSMIKALRNKLYKK